MDLVDKWQDLLRDTIAHLREITPEARPTEIHEQLVKGLVVASVESANAVGVLADYEFGRESMVLVRMTLDAVLTAGVFVFMPEHCQAFIDHYPKVRATLSAAEALVRAPNILVPSPGHWFPRGVSGMVNELSKHDPPVKALKGYLYPLSSSFVHMNALGLQLGDRPRLAALACQGAAVCLHFMIRYANQLWHPGTHDKALERLQSRTRVWAD